MDAAVNIAVSRSHAEVDALQLLWAILQEAANIINKLTDIAGFNPEAVLIVTEKELFSINAVSQSSPVFSESLEVLLEKAWLHASTRWSSAQVDIPALLAAILNTKTFVLSDSVSDSLHCNTEEAEKILMSFSGCTKQVVSSIPWKNHQQDIIEKYTENCSLLAERGLLDSVLGREQEIRQLIDILLRRRQNNPILTGESGVGKTSLVEGLALRIAAD